MLLIHLCFFFFSFLCPAFCSYLLFLLLLPCLAACFVVYVLAILFCWFLRVNGKRNCLCWVFWFNKKKKEALYVFGHAFFGFFWEVCLTAVGSCWWSQSSWICGKGGNFLYFWASKGFCLWSFGGLEQWYFLYLLCYFFFLFYLICLYWIVLKNSQWYCPLYLDR